MSYSELTQYNSPNYTAGREGKKVAGIVIHWWDDPARKPGFYGVISTLCSPNRRASAHAVVEEGKVAWLVDCGNTAWHAGSWEANLTTIGIECSPYATTGTLETLAELVADLWTAYGYLPLKGHQQYSATACPGVYMGKLSWLGNRARAIQQERAAKNKPETVIPSPGKVSPAPELSIDQLAHDVIAGKYGTGEERKRRLRDKYDLVQARVNQILTGKPQPTIPAKPKPTVDINALAQAVIRGEYGTGEERRRRLGANYGAVQARVNQILGY